MGVGIVDVGVAGLGIGGIVRRGEIGTAQTSRLLFRRARRQLTIHGQVRKLAAEVIAARFTDGGSFARGLFFGCLLFRLTGIWVAREQLGSQVAAGWRGSGCGVELGCRFECIARRAELWYRRLDGVYQGHREAAERG